MHGTAPLVEAPSWPVPLTLLTQRTLHFLTTGAAESGKGPRRVTFDAANPSALAPAAAVDDILDTPKDLTTSTPMQDRTTAAAKAEGKVLWCVMQFVMHSVFSGKPPIAGAALCHIGGATAAVSWQVCALTACPRL